VKGTIQFDAITHEILELLDQQVQTIFGRKFNDFTQDEKDVYQNRKRRILELRSKLQDLLGPS